MKIKWILFSFKSHIIFWVYLFSSLSFIFYFLIFTLLFINYFHHLPPQNDTYFYSIYSHYSLCLKINYQFQVSKSYSFKYFSEIFLRVKKTVKVKLLNHFTAFLYFPLQRFFYLNLRLKPSLDFFSPKCFSVVYIRNEIRNVNLYNAEEKTVIRFAY